jgi:MFS family permease
MSGGDREAVSDSERRVITVALLLAMSVAALEQLVVATAMPSIIAQFQGFDRYAWVASAYLIASTVTMPLYGKMADIWGRRRVLVFGLALFSLGSVLSGAAVSMTMLILMRALQGLGAGAIGPIVMTMIADLYSMQERGKVQGWFSAVWGISSVAGPAIGGVLTYYLSWRWVFFVTVPFSLLAIWTLMRHVREDVRAGDRPAIDWKGAALIAGGSTALLLAALGGPGRPQAVSAAWVVVGLVLLALLPGVETRAADPVLPLGLLRLRPIGVGALGNALVGGLFFGIDTFVPLFVQGVTGGNSLQTGRAITPLFLSWSLSVVVAAKLVTSLGFRRTALIGSSLIAVGGVLLPVGAWLPGREGPIFTAALVLVGLGLGWAVLCYTLAAQNAVDWDRRGVATGLVMFSRTMGGAMGIGLMGAALARLVEARLTVGGEALFDVSAALRPETHALLASDDLVRVQEALRGGLGLVFLVLALMALLGTICAACLPSGTGGPEVEEVEAALVASE